MLFIFFVSHHLSDSSTSQSLFCHVLTSVLSFLHRLFSVAFSLAFKMVSEIDMLSINRPLAKLLGLTIPHFNAMESEIFAGLTFDASVTEEKFKSKV